MSACLLLLIALAWQCPLDGQDVAKSPRVQRLRGGGQGLYMDAEAAKQKRGRVLPRSGPGKHIVDTMMSLEHFPTDLDPLPLPTTCDSINASPITDMDQAIEGDYNRDRVVCNAKGGEELAYRGYGLVGMAVDAPRKWSYAIPEVKGHRFWKKNQVVNNTQLYKRPSAHASQLSLSTTWREKMELKERKAAMRGVVAKLRIRAREAKEEQRLKLQARRQQRLENRLAGEKYQIITNRHKLAKMNLRARRRLKALEP